MTISKVKLLVLVPHTKGTGAVATAGLLAALKIKGQPISDLHKERIVIVGAGSAGTMSTSGFSKCTRLRCSQLNRSHDDARIQYRSSCGFQQV